MKHKNLLPTWLGLDGLARTRAAQDAARQGPDQTLFTQYFEPIANSAGPLAGCIIAVKDLFDVKGYVTKAGGVRRAKDAPAATDATSVAQLRAAGASFVGHTNMTELAYSGLGLNPHYGTPQTPLFAGALAGGSTSGGAAAVARGYADLALATDTGGSARIPATFCGVVGFKPTANRISRSGAVPLSFTLDSVGLIGRSVCDVIVGFDVFSPKSNTSYAAPRLLVVEGFDFDNLDEAVSKAFDDALQRLSRSEFIVGRFSSDVIEQYSRIPTWHFSAVESRMLHPDDWAEAHRLDPKVAARMARADEVQTLEYASTLAARSDFVWQMQEALASDILILPAVAIMPPKIMDCENPEGFDNYNQLVLHNTSLANIMDGCSITLPIEGHPGTGLMLVAAPGNDALLLAMAAQVESIISKPCVDRLI